MSHKLVTLPNNLLRQKSQKVGLITDDIKKSITDMKRITLEWEDTRKHEVGVALACVQMGELLKIVIVREDFDNKDNRNFTVFINPEITKYEGKIIEDFEGCLSIKDIYGKVPRHTKIKLKALDENGQAFRVTAEGFLARVFQHEIDHTKGVLFIDHIKENVDSYFSLTSKGELEKIDYEEQISNNSILW